MNAAQPIAGLILNYRDWTRTARCASALAAAGIERVLVWDNTEASAHAPAAPLPRGVEISGCGENLGFARGANRGMRECLKRWPDCRVLLVNNDAVVPAGLPQRLADAMAAEPRCALAFPPMQQGRDRIGWAWYQPWLGLITLAPAPGAFRYASGCCQLIAPERAGDQPFDERFFMYGEDIALASRLAREGWREVLVDGEPVLHEGSATSRNGSLFYETLLVESHVRLTAVIAGGVVPRTVMLIARIALVLPARALLRSLRMRSLAPLRGLVIGIARAFGAPRPMPPSS